MPPCRAGNLTLTLNNGTMKAKKIGIWMDHEHAQLTEFTTDPMKTTTIHNEFSHSAKHQSLGKGENNMHVKENHQLAQYYKKLAGAIRDCEEVVLFGPTSAKNELLNILKADHLFAGTKMSAVDTDKMSVNQIQAFVRKHLEKA
jgi:stalled ribosome rescue protein Dom34